MEGFTQRLAEFAADLTYEDLPSDVVDSAKEKLVDYIAVAVAGIKGGKLFSLLLPYMKERGEKGVSHAIGTGDRFSSATAALLNGTAAHSIDLDDGHREALGHPGVAVWSAVLAEGEARRRSGKEAILAAVVGYETFVRLGKTLNPGIITRGFHTTGVCGSLAAASAAGKLISLNASQTARALGIAGLFSSGLMIVTQDGAMMKPLNAGRAAENGILAAEMTERGAEGAGAVVESRDGFAQAFSGLLPEESRLDDLGARYGIKECYIKYYPACRHCHAAIDAAFALRKKIRPEDVKEIRIRTYPNALQLTLKESMPEDDAATRFNIAFAVALALATGRADEESFSMDSVRNPLIRDLFGKSKVVNDPSLESREKNIRGVSIEITAKSGETVAETVPLPRGEPENPGDGEDLLRKFDGCIGSFWDTKKKERVFSAVRNLERLDDLGTLLQLME